MELENAVPYAYPNDEVHWTIMIVLYPYISGLVVGAFIIYSLSYAFGLKQLAPVAKLALAAAIAFLCFTTAPLLLHLGRPERCFNMMLTPNPRSAMAGFGYIYSGYFATVAIQMWLLMRPTLVQRANAPGPLRLLYKLVCLGVLETTPESLELDQKVVRILAIFSVPFSCLLTGYVGFIFGTIKANPWWSTPLIPLIFILSALVSGTALMTILYWLSCKMRRVAVDQDCMRTLARFLWGFLIFDVGLELLELLVLAYESLGDWSILKDMMVHRIGVSFLGVQFLVGSLVPFLLLGWAVLSNKQGRKLEFAAYFSSFLLLLQVLSMRWNVIIGGQSFSKSFRSLQEYVPSVWGQEGLLAAGAILVAPFVVIAILAKMLPLFGPTTPVGSAPAATSPLAPVPAPAPAPAPVG